MPSLFARIAVASRCRSLLAMQALLAVAVAQSPLTTTFQSSTFLAGTTGVTVYFDLNVRTAVSIDQIDVNFFGAAGPQARIEVWTRNGTHIGNNSSAVGWSQAGVSATVTSNGRDVPTPMPFAVPIVLQPGVVGVAVQHFGAGAAYTAGTGVGLVYSSTAEMDFIQGGASNPPIFGGTQNAPRVMNCAIHYTPIGGFAAATEYGQGCGGQAQFRSYYENFPAGTFDLAGSTANPTVLRHINLGNGYLVLPMTGQWFTPTSSPLGLANGTVSPAQALGFPFASPSGATTTEIWICDDGYLWLDGPGIADFTPAVNELLTQGARMAPCWMSLNPAGGSIHFDVDPLGGIAYATWLQVQEQGTAATISMQVALYANGDFEYRYAEATLATLGNTFALVGMSPGGGAADPGNRDLSSGLPFTLGPDLVVPDLRLQATARPVLGTTLQLETRHLPLAAAVGATLFSFVKRDPGIDLTALGMPGCQRYLDLDTSVLFFPSQGVGQQGFAVPNQPSLSGVRILTQGAAFAPGSNPLGVISSNGLELLLDSL